MSLQEAAEAAARTQGGESSTSVPVPEPTSVPATEPISTTTALEQPTETAVILPDSMTQPLTNANDPDIPMVPGDSGTIPAAETAAAGGDQEMDEDEELRRAMALSRGADPEEDVVMAEDGEGDEEDDEEAAIARAIAMSLQEAEKEDDKEQK